MPSSVKSRTPDSPAAAGLPGRHRTSTQCIRPSRSDVTDTDKSFSLSSIPDRKIRRQRAHISCLGRWRLPFFERIRLAKRSARTSSKKLMANNPLFARIKDRSIANDARNAARALEHLARGAILADRSHVEGELRGVTQCDLF